MQKNEFALVLAIVKKGFADWAIQSAKEAGAKGATVLGARGSGFDENEKIFGITVQPEKEIVLVLTKEKQKAKIMRSIYKNTHLDQMGKGLCFSLPVIDLAGAKHFFDDEDAPAKQDRAQTETK